MTSPNHHKVRQVRGRAAILAFVGAIVIAPLDEASAHPRMVRVRCCMGPHRRFYD